jgi:chaperonin GroEL
VIRVGAATAAEQAALRLRVEAGVTAARLAVARGVVPGGGAALVACGRALEALEVSGDEAVGVAVLNRALSAPMRALARNAGWDAEPLVHGARRRGPGWAFDVLSGAWVDAWHAGLVDALGVTLSALEASASAATTALTAEVLVRRTVPSAE